ncbi:MAG: substrate-binding domain-containing protein [Pseudomonadota bacterium]
MFKSLIKAGVLALGASALALGASAKEFADMKFTIIFYTDASVEFWNPAIKGANDAAEQLGVDIDIQYGDSNPEKQNNIIQAAIANEVDGIGLGIFNSDAFVESICQAEEAGITVIAFNVDNLGGADASCRSAYVGQDDQAAGAKVAARLVEEFGLTAGDKVLAPVELPEATYAVKRSTGVKSVLEPLGIEVDVIRSTTNPGEAQTIIAQYLLANPDTKAVVGLGQTPTNAAPPAMAELGMELPLVGFDLSPQIADAIASGALTATVDQQPYSQGYFTVTQLALAKRYGLAPSNFDTSGTGLVDASNVDAAVEFMGITR